MSSEEETFDRLRRANYNEACAVYSAAIIYLRSGASMEERKELADPQLIPLGWTVEDIFQEAKRQRSDRSRELW